MVSATTAILYKPEMRRGQVSGGVSDPCLHSTLLYNTRMISDYIHSVIIYSLLFPGPYTIFVPTDAAFKKLTNATQQQLMSDNQLLTKVLKYHITAGKHRSSEFTNDAEIPSWTPGGKIRINFYGPVSTSFVLLNFFHS